MPRAERGDWVERGRIMLTPTLSGTIMRRQHRAKQLFRPQRQGLRSMLLLNYRIHHARNLLYAPLTAKRPSARRATPNEWGMNEARAETNKFVKILPTR